MVMYRTYQNELIDKHLVVSRDNEIAERNTVADWLEQHANWDIRKYYNNISSNVTVKEAFNMFKNTVEPNLPEEQRASNWNEFINNIRNIDKKRPITTLENIAITYMNRRTNNGLRSPPSSSNNNRSNVPSMPGTPNSLHTSKVSFIQIEGNTERRIEPNSFMTSTKLTQFIYIGSKDETNSELGIVKTLYSNVRDQEFENKWYSSNCNAKLFCIKHECYVPVSKIEIWDTRDDIYPEKQSFTKFVSSVEPDKSIEKIEKYISIAISQLDDYLELDETDREGSITHTYIKYMKSFIGNEDDSNAIEELKKLSKKRKFSDVDYDTTSSSSTKRTAVLNRISYRDYDEPSNLDYCNDEELIEENRKLWKNKEKSGYYVLNETNNDWAPFGYTEDMKTRIAPYGFIKDDPNNRVRKKINTRAKSENSME